MAPATGAPSFEDVIVIEIPVAALAAFLAFAPLTPKRVPIWYLMTARSK
jgi:hypothetical protein